MEFFHPATWAEALRQGRPPDAVPISGGTEVMVELNFDLRRPSALIAWAAFLRTAGMDVGGGTVQLARRLPYAGSSPDLAGPPARDGRWPRAPSARRDPNSAT